MFVARRSKKKGGRVTPKKPQGTRLHVIPEPAPGTRSVFQKPAAPRDDRTPFVTNGGALNYVCGNPDCGLLLLKNVEIEQVSNLVFKCPSCGSYNETIF
jgi:hypothetical protein